MNRAEHRQYEEGRAEQYLSAVAVLDQHKRARPLWRGVGGLLRGAACALASVGSQGACACVCDLYFSASGSN